MPLLNIFLRFLLSRRDPRHLTEDFPTPLWPVNNCVYPRPQGRPVIENNWFSNTSSHGPVVGDILLLLLAYFTVGSAICLLNTKPQVCGRPLVKTPINKSCGCARMCKRYNPEYLI